MGPASIGDSRHSARKERNSVMAKYRQRSRESLEFFSFNYRRCLSMCIC